MVRKHKNYLNKKQLKNFLVFLLSLLIFFITPCCVKDKPESSVQSPVQLNGSNKVYVINEGNYGSGNGSVSLFDPSNQQVVSNLYFTQNNSSPGDVVQSLTKINNSFYLVVNNSKKIIQCDAQFKKIGQILDLNSPRFILQISNQKAYVSDLYANAISIINLNTNSKTGSIVCPGKTEKMVMIYNKVFVTNTEKNYVYVINTTLDQIEDSIFVGINASSLILDKQDRLWVLASGDQVTKSGRLSSINTLSHHVEKVFEFELVKSPWQLCVSKNKDSLFFINEDIYRMALDDPQLPTQIYIGRGTKNFYGLGVSSIDNTLYVSDAIDYSQASTIYVYDQMGRQTLFFKAGINANGFYFE